MNSLAIPSTMLIVILGCSASDPKSLLDEDSELKSTLKLGSDTFDLKKCVIWGQVGKIGNKWHCRWSIEADGTGRTYTQNNGDQQTTYLVQPALAAHSLAIDVTRWRDLDGVVITTSEDANFDYFANSSLRANYTLRTTTSNQRCYNNAIRIEHVEGSRFHVHWTGDAELQGVEGDSFELDAVATLTYVTLLGEVDVESGLDDAEIGNVFHSIFPDGDFEQHPVEIERFEDNGVGYLIYESRFTPALR